MIASKTNHVRLMTSRMVPMKAFKILVAYMTASGHIDTVVEYFEMEHDSLTEDDLWRLEDQVGYKILSFTVLRW